MMVYRDTSLKKLSSIHDKQATDMNRVQKKQTYPSR